MNRIAPDPGERTNVMTRRTALVGVTWLASAAGAVLLVVAGQFGGTGLSGSGFPLVFAGLAVDVVVYASVGAILTLRRPGNLVGLVLMAAAILIVLTFIGFIFGAVPMAARGNEDVLAGLAALLGGLGIIPTLILAGPALALLFPNGHLPGPRWRWPVRAIAAVLAVGKALVAVRPGPIGDSLANNPFGVTGITWLEASGLGESLTFIALPAALLLALAGVIVRFRQARGAERQQLEWFVAANVMVAVFISLSVGDGAPQPTAFDLLAPFSLSLLPLAVGIAVLRYRLYEIDRLISRGVTYGLLTGVLAAFYEVTVVALEGLLSQVAAGSTLAVAGSTLLVAALFQPLRRRIQHAVDRRFHRARYDAESTATAFARVIRDEVDPTAIEGPLLVTVESAVRPQGASFWLRGGAR